MSFLKSIFGRPKTKQQFAKMPTMSKEQLSVLGQILKASRAPIAEAQKGLSRFDPGTRAIERDLARFEPGARAAERGLVAFEPRARAAERGFAAFAPAQSPEADRMAQEAAAGYQQFLPGGGGGQPIVQAALNRFQQQTLPSIMQAYGSGAKTSSALNQALAAGAANLNTDLAAQLAGMQLTAASGLGGLSGQQSRLGLDRSAQEIAALQGLAGTSLGRSEQELRGLQSLAGTGLGRSEQELRALQTAGGLGADRARLQLGASGELGRLGLGQLSAGLGVSPFSYAQRSNPLWKDLTLGAVGAGGQVFGGALAGGYF